MMCSTWKISVFGIVALMLAFGLVAGDALAHSDGHTVSAHAAAPRAANHFDDATLTAAVYSSPTADPRLPNGNGDGAILREGAPLKDIPAGMKLRATEILDSIVFTYTPGVTTTKGRNIVLTIPGGWTQPVIDNNDGINEAGEITINQGTVSIGAGGGGWRILTGNYDPAPTSTSPVMITYKRVTVPKRAGAYHFSFASNLVGAGHVSQLDSHLRAHATQVVEIADQNASNRGHGDVGSTEFVQVHDHTVAEWTFNIAVHSHAGTEIARVSAHTHMLNTDTPSVPDDVKLTPVVDHAHSGAAEAVLAAPAHTHPQDGQFVDLVQDHDHGSNGVDVTAVKSHEHTSAGVSVTPITSHSHSTAMASNGVAPEHTHTAVNTNNAMVAMHNHSGGIGAAASSVYAHSHGGDDMGITSVPAHSHDGDSDNDPNYTLTGGVGPHHTHAGDGGNYRLTTGHAHADDPDDATVTGAASAGTAHTHAIDATTGRIAESTAATFFHGHGSAMGIVQLPVDHNHTAATSQGSTGLAHRHAISGVIYGGVQSPLPDHSHSSRDDAPDQSGVIQHEHTSNYLGVKPVSHHAHASPTAASGGSQAHQHASGYISVAAPIEIHTHGSGETDHDDTATVAEQAHTHAMGFYSATHASAIYAGIHQHTTLTAAASSNGIVHTHATSGTTLSTLNVVVEHTHDADDIATVTTGTVVLHTHSGLGRDFAEVTAHTHTAGAATTSATTSAGPPHQHGTDPISVAASTGPSLPGSAHRHTSHMAPAGTPLHVHVAGYDGVDTPPTHTHVTAATTSTAGIPHSHTATYLGLNTVVGHTHTTEQTAAGSPQHHHTGEFSMVETITEPDHQHTMNARNGGFPLHSHAGVYSGGVRVPPTHSHTGSFTNHVVQNLHHVHALDRNGRYVMNVGPAPSGSGSLAFRNTGSPSLVKHGVDGSPYKGRYLVTKGQALGDLILTYTAAGTMMKGSGIRIMTDLPIDQGFYFYNVGGPGGGVVLERGSAMFVDDPLDTDTSGTPGISKDALYVKTTASLEAGSQIGFRVRNLNIKAHGKVADGMDPTLHVADYTLSALSSSPLVADGDAPLEPVDDGKPTITVTGAHKSGETKLKARGIEGDFTHATAEEELQDLIFTFNTKQPMATGSQVQIQLPQGWSIPFHATSVADGRSGAITLAGIALANLTIDGMVLTATTTVELNSDVAGALTFTYKKIKAPAKHGTHEFITRTTAGPHGTLVELGRIGVDIAGTHGAGSIALTQGGTTLRQAATGQALGNLVFTYTAAGRMAKDSQVQITVPQGWTSPHLETVDGVDAPGEVSISSGNANLNVTGGGGRPWKLTATTTAALDAGGTIVFNYKVVTAPGAADSYTFETHQTSFKGALVHIDNIGARLASSPTVGVGQAPDGAGTMTVAKSATPAFAMDATGAYLANAGESLGNLTFTYTATGIMQVGASVSLQIPEPWTQPVPDNGDSVATAGETVVAGAGVVGGTVVDRVITATVSTEIVSGNSFSITYKNVNAPTAVGEYDFTAQSKSTATSTTPKNLSDGSPTIKVGTVPVGVVSISTTDADGMSTPLMAAGPGMAIGNVTITYTATARITAGAKVTVTVPVGWTAPNVDNNDGVDGAGEVSLTGNAVPNVTGGGGQPWQLVATTNATLESGSTLVFTYKNVTTPSAEMDYEFTTMASISATSTPVAITAQQSVTIRAVVTAIAIEAEDSFFAGESLSGMVTLWGGMAAANALGDVVIYLSTSSETGSFGADMITIADNMPGAAFTYMDTAPGTVTLTASDMMPAADDAADTAATNGADMAADTSGALMATKTVTVKSGVAGLSVTPDLVKAGSDVTVTATGKAGGGTVKVMDSDGMQHGATKSLDPVVEPEEGDVTYSRTITLPADLADGTYTVTVDIQGLMDSMDIEVLNDQAPPTLSGATASPMTVVNGDLVTLSVMAASTIDITSVMADLSAVDSTQTEMVSLTQQGDGGTYFYVFTISDMNTAEDGEASITITATDRIKNAGTAMVSVTLDNVQVTLDSVSVEPDMPYEPGETAWIKATGTAGGTVSATVNNSETGMMIAQVTLEEMEGTPGSYVAGLTIVEDAHPEGMYDVTVTLGDQSMTAEGALTIVAAPSMPMFSLSIPAGTHLIHVPLDVTQIDGMDATIDTVGDLYDALGDAANFIISLGADGNWNSYLGDASTGTVADAAIGDDTGLIAVMSSAATLNLTGNALGTGGVSTISLGAGSNLVGLPLDSAQISMISDVVASPLVSAVVVSNAAGDGFNTIAQPGDPGDGAPMGGDGYIVVAAAAASIPIIGMAWDNSGMMVDMGGGMDDMTGGMTANGNGNGPSAAPSIGFRTPVLQVQGMLIDEAGMVSRDGLSVSVKNLSSGSVLGRTSATDAYSMTFVKLDSSAAKVGDVLEIRADSPNPLLGIRPVQHVVTSDDVLNNRISLPDLVTYEIPALTELLANYPNPFNPETWVPFRLAEDANVSLTIYGASGSLVRTIDIGFTPAAVYQGRSDAIYWDGRNNFGEQVSSGIYFYHLNAGDFSATRKMVIVK